MKWISVKDKLPTEDQIVDLWDGRERHTDYKLILNHGGKIGNNFFRPTKSGVTVIRYNDSAEYRNATHWATFTPPSTDKQEG